MGYGSRSRGGTTPKHPIADHARELAGGRALGGFGWRETIREHDVAQMTGVERAKLGHEDALTLLVDFVGIEHCVRPAGAARR